ncbi:hypothetical protein [Bradyrhizobium centrolobii]|uniref:hypothetical protein n=1 Tax=Bradyrhizobium centrolobii TaxID=1505087 RepID=UPI000B03F747|nr:hypothetical protein [Bradyrhizobium centrolobii]
MKAQLAWLTSPEPNVYMLNIQPEGWISPMTIELSESHLANIVADGAHFALRKSRMAGERHGVK